MMTGLHSAFKTGFLERSVFPSHPLDALNPFDDRLSPPLIDPFPDFDVIEEWICEPDFSAMPGDGHPPGLFENLISGNPISGSGENRTPAGENRRGVVGSSFCENPISDVGVAGESPFAEKLISDSGVVGEGGDVVASKAEDVDGFLRRMKIEDDSELGGVGEVAAPVKEEVVEGYGGGFASMGGNGNKGVVKSDEDGSSSSSSSDTSSSDEEEEEEEKDEEQEQEDDDDAHEEEEEVAASSSSSTSSSSSSVEEEDSVDAEVEEGEIRDSKMKKGGVFVDTDLDEEEEVMNGPIKSTNELGPENLPPVPSVDVILEPQHITLPVGVVLSIMENKVIVEGSEKHNPLTEGSILWITETRSPLGLVDEIFGPVKNPYYVVRFNSDKEVPLGIHEGTTVSFVPEFAEYVLNNKDIYEKGYDASGANDEENLDEVEFSDDEKEAEFKKSQQRKTKRQTIDKKVKQVEFMERRKNQNRGGFSNRSRQADSAEIQCVQPQALSAVSPLIPGHQRIPLAAGQFVNGNSLHSASQSSLPSTAATMCPLQLLNSQQMPNASVPSVCPPHIPNSQQIPNSSSNLFGFVGGSFAPVPGLLGACGTITHSFGSHGLPVPNIHAVQQTGHLGNPSQSFQQQLPPAWTSMPSYQQQQPVFSCVQNNLWARESAGQPQLGLLGNPLQGVQNFVSPGGLQQQPGPQVPGCTHWQGFVNQPSLNGVAFPGGNMHGHHAGNAVQQWNPLGGLNAEQSGPFNANQYFGQFVPGTANNFPTPGQFNQINASGNKRQPPKGGSFHGKKGHWQRPR